MKYNDNGEYKDIYVKAFDTLPIGTQVNFNGTSADIPNGWEQVGTSGNLLIIEKTSQYIEGGATLENTYGTSQSNGYSQEFLNGTTIFEDTVNGGVNTDITLTDNISNYKYIEVLCRRGLRNDNAGYNIVKIPIEATSENITLSFSWRGSAYLEDYASTYTLTGTSMTLSYFITRKTTISNNTSTLDTTTNNVYVKRITGYKY